MPIIGLTDPKSRSVSRGVATFGKIRKGAPKPQNGKAPGKDLDHFRVDFDPQYLHFEGVFNEIYGSEPTEFDALLVGKTVDDVFSTWNESWTQTKLLHRCDGQTQHVSWNDQSNRYNRGVVPCVGGHADKYECAGLCKRIGRLAITLPALNEAVGEFGKFIITTHSFYDITKITNQLALLESALNTLMFVPVTVGRVNEEKTRPDDNNGRAKATFSLLYLKVKTASIQAYIDQQSTPQLQAPTMALPDTVTRFNHDVPELPPGDDQPELDVTKITAYVRKAIPDLTEAQVYQLLVEYGVESVTTDNKLEVIAMILDYRNGGNVDASVEQAKVLVSGDALGIVTDYLIMGAAS